ncbi:ATP-binding protein [Maritalea mediterranea]|uniref:ATP-binding protein n=1 Tax=Maritalea mediterranea TaxID=2909667 RepID=A0ABS9E5Y9_9HYPH|nr:ATP-binding protein [Maritalea mediterranea]MCF4098288.1 ATP-binding protein [Maritalea mediterranea]
MKLSEFLADIAQSLRVLAHRPGADRVQLTDANAYQWEGHVCQLLPVARVNRVDLDLLQGIEPQKKTLLDNSLQFAKGFGANNALLWGAKGMGKSSIVKAIHGEIAERAETDPTIRRLILVEIHREDISTLPELMRKLAPHDAQFLIYCDDLSFDREETDYKALKTVLDGGLEGRPKNVLFYATSNRRHLMARDMIDNEARAAIHSNEANDEKISLSDRFGLWIGFHNCDQDTYLQMINGYCAHFGIEESPQDLRAQAIEWAQTRGSRSGRVAIQFVRHLAGKKGRAIS